MDPVADIAIRGSAELERDANNDGRVRGWCPLDCEQPDRIDDDVRKVGPRESLNKEFALQTACHKTMQVAVGLIGSPGLAKED